MSYANTLYDRWHAQHPGTMSPGTALALAVHMVCSAPPEPYPETLTEDYLWEHCRACQHHLAFVQEHRDGDAWAGSVGLYRGDLCSDHRNDRAGHRMRAESSHSSAIRVFLRRAVAEVGLTDQQIEDTTTCALEGLL